MKMKVYSDRQLTNFSPIITKYKSKTVLDAGCFYVPFIPLKQKQILETKHLGWTIFTLTRYDRSEVLNWCKANLGRQYKGIYLKVFNIWIGNLGSWRADYNITEDSCITVWLHKPNDIALFKMVWNY